MLRIGLIAAPFLAYGFQKFRSARSRMRRELPPGRGAVSGAPVVGESPIAGEEEIRGEGARRFGGGQRDIVDEASWESFPASDPPAW